jgi:hypothetical protein
MVVGRKHRGRKERQCKRKRCWLRSCVNRWLVSYSIRESRRIWSLWMHFHWTWWVHNVNSTFYHSVSWLINSEFDLMRNVYLHHALRSNGVVWWRAVCVFPPIVIVLMHAIKAYKWGWVVSFTARPLYPWGRITLRTETSVVEAGCVPGQLWTLWNMNKVLIY